MEIGAFLGAVKYKGWMGNSCRPSVFYPLFGHYLAIVLLSPGNRFCYYRYAVRMLPGHLVPVLYFQHCVHLPGIW